ncbi:MAG: apolipoprotein N-acyltransferase [Isosphaeraceae bacterium]
MSVSTSPRLSAPAPGPVPAADPGGRVPSAPVLAGACLLSTLLLLLSQGVRGWGWLALLGLTPVALVLEPGRLRRTWVLLGGLAALFTAATTWWVVLTGPGYLFAWMLLPVYAALLWGLAAVCCRAAGPRHARADAAPPWWGMLALPAAWALAELVARRAGLGVSWALVGQPLVDSPLLTETVAAAGPEALSFFAAGVAVAAALALRRAPVWATTLGVVQPVVFCVAGLVAGSFATDASPPPGRPFRVAVVQPNARQLEKWEIGRRAETLARVDRLIDSTEAGRPDLVALPETAMAGFVRFEDDLTAWVKSTVGRTGRSLLFGTLDRNDDGSSVSNAAVLITPYGTVTTYRKTRLVPLSERVPALGPLRPLLFLLRGGAGEFTPGQEYTLFQIHNRPVFGAAICFEDTFPDLVRGFALRGASALFVLVNTERFDGTGQTEAHLKRARLSALANGLPLVRCANTGVSCTVDAEGGRRRLGSRESAPRRTNWVPSVSQATVYRRFGDRLPAALYGSAVVFFCLAARGSTGPCAREPRRCRSFARDSASPGRGRGLTAARASVPSDGATWARPTRRFMRKYGDISRDSWVPAACVLAVAGWTAWVAAMALWGEPFDLPLPRAFARVLTVLVPALGVSFERRTRVAGRGPRPGSTAGTEPSAGGLAASASRSSPLGCGAAWLRGSTGS